MPKKENMEEYSSYESPIPRSLQTSRAPRTYEEIFEKKIKEFHGKQAELLDEKRVELNKATQKYIDNEKILSNYKELCKFYGFNDMRQKHANTLKEAFEEHQKNGQVSKKDEQSIQDFKKAYDNYLQSAYMYDSIIIVTYSSEAIAIFKEKPKEGIEILKLCTEFLKVHNEWEITYLKREQALQSNNATPELSDSYVNKLAQNRAKSNSNSNKNSL
mgnify:CR=1 FL=1